jgi:uncharacterized Zn finger protein
MWVASEEDNTSTEEKSDNDLEEEVFESNKKNENHTFNIEKIKYKSKVPGKRIPKYYSITTYNKCMDKLKRDRR